jgi:hypothetical protein
MLENYALPASSIQATSGGAGLIAGPSRSAKRKADEQAAYSNLVERRRRRIEQERATAKPLEPVRVSSAPAVRTPELTAAQAKAVEEAKKVAASRAELALLSDEDLLSIATNKNADFHTEARGVLVNRFAPLVREIVRESPYTDRVEPGLLEVYLEMGLKDQILNAPKTGSLKAALREALMRRLAMHPSILDVSRATPVAAKPKKPAERLRSGRTLITDAREGKPDALVALESMYASTLQRALASHQGRSDFDLKEGLAKSAYQNALRESSTIAEFNDNLKRYLRQYLGVERKR